MYAVRVYWLTISMLNSTRGNWDYQIQTLNKASGPPTAQQRHTIISGLVNLCICLIDVSVQRVTIILSKHAENCKTSNWRQCHTGTSILNAKCSWKVCALYVSNDNGQCNWCAVAVTLHFNCHWWLVCSIGPVQWFFFVATERKLGTRPSHPNDDIKTCL